ncbi:MAG: ABC transporter permease [Pirellulales bacterium]|nr:ABC transporter permease [Pirellulales bacterium]
MLGPVFSRAWTTLPRRGRFYLLRAGWPAALLGLMLAAWLVVAGTQVVRNTGDFARFGGMLFEALAPLQLALVVFLAAILAATSVAAEKDRRTLDLLLLSELSSAQFVLGKLCGVLLEVLAVVAAAAPLFWLWLLFGGIGVDQIARALLVTVATAVVAGSLGSTIALWRDKTFQTLAITAILLVLWLVFWEVVALGGLGASFGQMSAGDAAVVFSPWRAILAATRPRDPRSATELFSIDPVWYFAGAAFLGAVLLNAWGIARFRVWNPPREVDERPGAFTPREALVRPSGGGARDMVEVWSAATHAETPPTAAESAPGTTRPVWDQPVLWREMRTWAYGRKVLLVRTAYLVFCALAMTALVRVGGTDSRLTRVQAAAPLVPLVVLSLVLVNAQAVTSITMERDSKAFDLLLVTDLTPREFVFGKLVGVLYNTKEMVLVPMLLSLGLCLAGQLSIENLLYLVGGYLALVAFAAMLGVHAGLTYEHSPSAVAVSLGTVFFLFVGVGACMRVMIAFSGSFGVQMQPFLAFMGGGGVGLFLALGVRNPSTALLIASLACPFVTFFAITSFLLGQTLNVFLVTTAMYSFATAAMLVPAIHEFDVTTGRTTLGEE